MRFIVLMGVVSLLADACYEGARSITGPLLGTLGASAGVVGAVVGAGELVGYALRYVTGRIADRTGAYWTLTLIGYGTNLVAVPLLAVAGTWQVAAALIVLERLGKAIRNPARSTLLSLAAGDAGQGRAFAVHQALDQIGGMLGPLLVAAIVWWRGAPAGYALALATLAAPAVLTMVALLVARRRYPDPRVLAPPSGVTSAPPPARAMTVYLLGVALVGIGLADWALLAFHLQHRGLLGAAAIPLVYAAAMAADGGAALVIGGAFDRARARGGSGLPVLAAALAVGATSVPLVLLAGPVGALLGVAAWAVALGATESIGKATVARLSTPARRGAAYGTYYAVFGVAWWVGSITIGALSDHHRQLAAVVAAGALLAGAALMLATDRALRHAAA